MTIKPSNDKARYLCGKLGMCWHESPCNPNGEEFRCIHCGKMVYESDIPTFLDPVGIHLLLEKMRERDDWYSFCVYLYRLLDFNQGVGDFLSMFILDRTGKLLDAAYRWFREREK